MAKKKAVIIIFILALVVRSFYVLSVSQPPLVTDAKDYDTLGIMLSQGKGYINSEGEPTAYRPPIYPLFLGVIYSTAGHNLLWVRLIQAVMGAASCVLVYLITVVIFNEMRAILSGFLCCFYPPLIVNTSQILTETLFIFFLLLGILCIISKSNFMNLLLSGLIFGLALLTRPFLIFFLPFLFAWIVFNKKYKARKAVAVLVAGVLIVLLPWTLRNYYKLNSFVPFANVGGLTLYNSYVVPQKGFGFNSLEGVGGEYYEITEETSQNRYLIQKTTEYIKENPLEVVKLSIKKILLFIYPFDGYWYNISFGSKYNVFWGIILCFSVLGIAMNLNENTINKTLIYFLFISFLIGIVIFYGSPRFRLPIEPLLICFASDGMIRFSKENLNVLFMIVLINTTLFIVFRYFKLNHLFHYLKKWM